MEFYCYCSTIEQKLKAECLRTKMGQYNWKQNARKLMKLKDRGSGVGGIMDSLRS